MAIKCCNGCVPPKRHTACWGHCQEYIAEKARIEQDTAEQRMKKQIHNGITEQKSHGVYRALRRKRMK